MAAHVAVETKRVEDGELGFFESGSEDRGFEDRGFEDRGEGGDGPQ